MPLPNEPSFSNQWSRDFHSKNESGQAGDHYSRSILIGSLHFALQPASQQWECVWYTYRESILGSIFQDHFPRFVANLLREKVHSRSEVELLNYFGNYLSFGFNFLTHKAQRKIAMMEFSFPIGLAIASLHNNANLRNSIRTLLRFIKKFLSWRGNQEGDREREETLYKPPKYDTFSSRKPSIM